MGVIVVERDARPYDRKQQPRVDIKTPEGRFRLTVDLSKKLLTENGPD